MLFLGAKKEAVKIYEKAAEKYNKTYEALQASGIRLYEKRKDALEQVAFAEELINSIANRPKSFDTTLEDIRIEREKFADAEEYGRKSLQSDIGGGVSAAAGIAGGAAVAGLAPSVAMWVATTFGTASTGTAISALSGAVATKAALAWLGGGALAAGGAGIAGGQALLALAGPVGWGIAGVSTVASATISGVKNKKLADEAMEEAKKITLAGSELHETTAQIDHLFEETKLMTSKFERECIGCETFKGANYGALAEEDQYRLGSLVNNTLSLVQIVNQVIEEG